MFLLTCQSGMDCLMVSLTENIIGHLMDSIMDSLMDHPMEHLMDKPIHLMGLGINPLISLLTMAL